MQMIIDLTQILGSEKAFDFSCQPDLEEETARLFKPVQAVGKLKKGIIQVDIEGEITGGIEIDCTRCLLPVKQRLEIRFKVGYLSVENYTKEAEAHINTEDLEIAIYEDEQINLEELVREQIILSLPTQFFCKEGCKGLCQKCGANKNLQDCNCQEKEVDPRWSALNKLKD